MCNAPAFDVEHYTVVCNNAGVTVDLLDVCWPFPNCPFSICVPGLQRLSCVWMAFPEFP